MGWNSTAINCKVYNNTFTNFNEASVYPMINLSGGSGNEIRNNLFFNTPNISVSANMTSNNLSAANNPFVDYLVNDFHITSEINGYSLPSLYNTDMDGNVRGADGVWDIGAYEYVSGSDDTTFPGEPSGLQIH